MDLRSLKDKYKINRNENNPWIRKDLAVLRPQLGSGYFGNVWIARHTRDWQYYAVKQVHMDRTLDTFLKRNPKQSYASALAKLEREVHNQQSVKSCFVTRY